MDLCCNAQRSRIIVSLRFCKTKKYLKDLQENLTKEVCLRTNVFSLL